MRLKIAVSSVRFCLSALIGESWPKNCGRSTAVVRLLAKEKVVGSNPIARSSSINGWHEWFSASHLLPAKMLNNAWRRRQVARQGSAKPSSWVQIPSSPLKSRETCSFCFNWQITFQGDGDLSFLMDGLSHFAPMMIKE